MGELNNDVLISYLKVAIEAVKDTDARLTKQEQLLLTSFSYLYNKNAQYESDLSYTVTSLKSEIDDLRTSLNTFVETYNDNTQKQSFSKQKPKKPWYWCFVKYHKYKKLLKAKLALEKSIDEANELKRQKLLQLEKERLEREKELEQKRKEEQERRHKEMQKQINDILSQIR